MRNLLGFLALLSTNFIIFPAESDTLTVEPVFIDVEGSTIDIYDVYNNDTGEWVGQQNNYADPLTDIQINQIITTED